MDLFNENDFNINVAKLFLKEVEKIILDVVKIVKTKYLLNIMGVLRH